jgi:hypothetical protein
VPLITVSPRLFEVLLCCRSYHISTASKRDVALVLALASRGTPNMNLMNLIATDGCTGATSVPLLLLCKAYCYFHCQTPA